MYIEVPSHWKLGYEESIELLKIVLNQLGLCNGETARDIDKYMFNNEISKETKEKILDCINKQLLLSLSENKMENYRNLYNNNEIDELANPDLFVRYYCENYYMMKCYYNLVGKKVLDVYFSCCISKTEEEIEEEERKKQLKVYQEIKEEQKKREEEKIRHMYHSNFTMKSQYSFEQVKNKYFLGKSYNEKATYWCDESYKAIDKKNNNLLSIYVGKLYVTIINALKSDCIGFEYELFWQKLNDFRFSGMNTVTPTDMEYLRIIMVEYHSLKEQTGLSADLETTKIYTKAYKMKLPQYCEFPEIDALPILPW